MVKTLPARLLVALLFPVISSPARACAVCFGGASPDLARGFYWGVVLLLLLPPVMALSFAGAIILRVRKNRRSSPPPA